MEGLWQWWLIPQGQMLTHLYFKFQMLKGINHLCNSGHKTHAKESFVPFPEGRNLHSVLYYYPDEVSRIAIMQK